MIFDLLDEASTRAGERYVNFLLSLRGVLGSSLSTRPDDTRVFDQIRRGAYAVAETFIDNEEDTFAHDLETVRARATALALTDVLGPDVEITNTLTDYSDELVTWFRQELRAQIERDVNVIVQKRRELVLQAQMRTRVTGLDLMSAYLDLIRQGREKADFYFTDRGGRRYPSQKFARQLYRQGMLTFGVETYALEVASLGVKEVEVVTRDSNNSYSGQRITLVGDEGMLKFSDVRDEVFHPNSYSFIQIVGGPIGS